MRTNQIKRNISRSQIQTSSDTSTEESDDSSDEVSSKRQKLNESVRNTNEGNLNDNTVTFQRNTLIAEQQNYHLISESVENESSNTNLRARSETTNNYQSTSYKHEDNGNKWEATKKDEWEKQEKDKDKDKNNEEADNLKIRKIFPNWHIVPEVINRQIGSNQLFERRFYSSLYAVEHLQLMYKLNESILNYQIIKLLNFNHKGNLLMCVICDMISIWDWAVGKKKYSFTNKDNFFISDTKWLSLENLIAFSDNFYQIYLLDIESNISMKLATHDGILKLAVHPEIPYVIFSAGIDSRVLSIDIRESKPKELFVVKENLLKVPLHSINFNPSNSNELCVAGQSYCVMVYDQRNVSKPLYKLWPNYVVNNDYVFVTSATYNYNGTEILVSYNHKELFLFNKLKTLSCGDYGHMYENYVDISQPIHAFWLIIVYNGYFFGPKSEYVISGSDNNIFIWEKNSECIIQYMTGDTLLVTHLASHPHIPILATCGFENNIKLWMPSKGKLSVMQSFGNVRM
ncbi:DDB1- and CUL4-associated factor 8 [Atta colombica]|uniref:DDB1-and CUL4-associated factor 8 n=1 Tax=Atta colombica TaxID=520822 RepID=A0A195BFI0_9HYME|nr:DDB1- and CUL4-associated factor 8 [Atta colombica]